jgi:oligopeptide transport system ATP-binding protein
VLEGGLVTAEPVLEAQHLKKYFPVTKGLALQRTVGWVRAVDDVSFAIRPGETLSLVGESGAGKTTVAKMVLLLETLSGGTLLFHGKDVSRFGRAELKEYRSNVQAVFQDPWGSMNPRMRVKTIVAEPLVVNTTLSKREIQRKVLELLAQVGLRPDQAELYPHEFSGGQRQRIAVARALALNPQLVVLDEPVSALDVSIRAQIMNLLKDIQSAYGLSYLLIAHNLATVRYMSHAVAIMYLGQIVEYAEGDELFEQPLHPYTKALMAAALPTYPDEATEENVLSGEMPSPLNPPPGCHFHPRCPHAMAICREVAPAVTRVGSSHQVSCHLYG